MSPSVSSASLVNSTLSTVPMCNYGKEAVLRISNIPRNPGRTFFECPLYNKEELPYCKYFKWADDSEYKKQALVKIEAEILRKDEELKKREEKIGKRELARHNDEA
ncbi:uncharacterized protein LOC122307456 [Carya illinoinensis]|uniref:uncharacterized protein LOC122307456 n=1 Tax=Carya illinoinensis TaxID=32201 RepID=UPI001C71DEF6|nr:uncharacterized protein LOC122307456 [Carya illinoinensis]